MYGCIRCGEPIKQGNAYHTKRADTVDVNFHAYDCTQKGSQRLVASALFKNGAIVCPCGEPILAEKTPTVADAMGTYKCPSCSRSYEIAAIFASRRPGKVLVADRLGPAPQLQIKTPLRLPMTQGLERF